MQSPPSPVTSSLLGPNIFLNTLFSNTLSFQRLKVPNWKTLVQDRRRWKEVVGKAKTLH